jgi:hypothetical protein
MRGKRKSDIARLNPISILKGEKRCLKHLIVNS